MVASAAVWIALELLEGPDHPGHDRRDVPAIGLLRARALTAG